ncbi:MAG: hypothetical protein K2M04_02600 [Muribaculaceae bacterium]|nr:hypothetical protein [Muribaculaceae bacterium]
MLAVSPSMYAHFKVFSVKGDVMVKQSGKTEKAVEGADISPAAIIIIPDGGSVEILDTRDSKTYKSTTPGQHSPSNIIFEARKQSVGTVSAVNRNLKIGRSGSSTDRDQVVYLAKGKVTRTLENYDPASDTLQIDNEMLGRFVARQLSRPESVNRQQFPVAIDSKQTPDGVLQLSVRNTLAFPVYFNVLKIDSSDPAAPVRLSEIGQPVGCYVLLPNQVTTRIQLADIDPDSRHFVVMAHYYFEVDRMLDAVNEARDSQSDAPLDLPVYLHAL